MSPRIARRFGLLLALLASSVAFAAPPATVASADALASAAGAQVGVTLSYDPAYTRIGYPGGDLPVDRGVCTDVVVRAFRAVGVDLQVLVHEDMRANFRDYPHKWGLVRPDPNIDHRRVPNLQRYFSRQQRAVPVSADAGDYLAGDVVSWKLPGGLDHIGVVTALRSEEGGRPMVVHNIGQGAQAEDVLFAWPQTGHYRWFAAAGSTPR